jgi:hypothetical protein
MEVIILYDDDDVDDDDDDVDVYVDDINNPDDDDDDDDNDNDDENGNLEDYDNKCYINHISIATSNTCVLTVRWKQLLKPSPTPLKLRYSARNYA